jgi:hypothetical protein
MTSTSQAAWAPAEPMTGTPLVKTFAHMVRSDARQRILHGRVAPRWAERVWIHPGRCTSVAPTLDSGRRLSGQVVAGVWREGPLETVDKIRMAVEHWQTGASWEEVGAVDFLVSRFAELRDRDGCSTVDDVARRFERLDEMFETMRRERRLRTRSELPGRSFREHRGVYVHIGAEGRPVFGGGGCHRLAAARVLGLEEIPAQLGAIHPDALGLLPALRSPVHG